MRWRPDADVCAECGFDWTVRRRDAIAVVEGAPGRAEQILQAAPDPHGRHGERWSTSMYLWHLVDVLRIGRERLLTIEIDPQRGVPCWDEKALADVRRYEALSWRVGLRCLRDETTLWLEVARSAGEHAKVDHPQFGAVGALEITSRTAHEVRHHLLDMSGELHPSRFERPLLQPDI